MTVSPYGAVVVKEVETGDIRGNLRVIRPGLTMNDRVIIDGLPYATPGSKVTAQDGTVRYAAAGQDWDRGLKMRLTHFFIDRPRFATVLSTFLTLLGRAKAPSYIGRRGGS